MSDTFTTDAPAVATDSPTDAPPVATDDTTVAPAPVTDAPPPVTVDPFAATPPAPEDLPPGQHPESHNLVDVPSYVTPGSVAVCFQSGRLVAQVSAGLEWFAVEPSTGRILRRFDPSANLSDIVKPV